MQKNFSTHTLDQSHATCNVLFSQKRVRLASWFGDENKPAIASVNRSILAPSMAALGSLTLANFGRAFSEPTILQTILNTAIVTVVTATVVTVLTMLTAWVVVRSKFRLRWVLDQTADRKSVV